MSGRRCWCRVDGALGPIRRVGVAGDDSVCRIRIPVDVARVGHHHLGRALEVTEHVQQLGVERGGGDLFGMNHRDGGTTEREEPVGRQIRLSVAVVSASVTSVSPKYAVADLYSRVSSWFVSVV